MKDRSPDRDERVTAELRATYAAPADAGYWDALEARIMARVADAGAGAERWWDAFAGWVRPGLVAAGIATVAAGAALANSRTAEAKVAFEAVIEAPPSLPLQAATHTAGLSEREATLRYVISH